MKLPTIRILPLTIAAGTLLLLVQLTSLWDTISLGLSTPARAEESKEAAADEHVAADAAKHGDTAADQAHGAEDKNSLADFSEAEIEVLYELSERRQLLDQREAKMAPRVALIDAAEQRIDARVRELQKLRTSIESLVRKYDDQENKDLESVVKIYETMKPKDAAAILEKLEMPVLLSIVVAMKERRSSAILAGMTPERAREVTAEMARKKTIDLSRESAVRNPG